MLSKLLKEVPDLVFNREEMGEVIFDYVEQEDFMYMDSLQGGDRLDIEHLERIQDFYIHTPSFNVFVVASGFIDHGYPLHIKLAVKNTDITEHDKEMIKFMLNKAVNHVKEYNPTRR